MKTTATRRRPAGGSSRWRVRAGWSWVAPLLLAGLFLRYLVPARTEAAGAPWAWLARLGDEHPLPLAVGLFLLFGWMIRLHRDQLPGGRHLREAARLAPGASLPWRATAWVSTVLIAVAAALGLRALVGQPYRVASASMLPTLAPRDYLLVNRRAGRPAGRLVVSRALPSGDRSEAFVVKRVVGLPGIGSPPAAAWSASTAGRSPSVTPANTWRWRAGRASWAGWWSSSSTTRPT